jgi:ferrous iron transport protein A
MRELHSLKKGEDAIIKKIGCTGELKKRFLEMGICSGSKIHVSRIAPLGDPIEVLVKGYKLSIRKSEAKTIIVE